MSLTRCVECDRIADADKYPEGYYDEHGNEQGFHCEWCHVEQLEAEEIL